jgi:manganese/iron transport system permease protein
MLNWLLTPFTYEFMQRGFIASVIIGIICSVIGCYVVIRSMAFMGDAMAHAILPGVAIAYVLNGSLTLGALVASIVIALGIGQLSKQGRLKEDTAIGVLFSAFLALGILIISSIRTYAVDLSHILFGNILGVSRNDLIFTAVAGFIIILFIFIFYKEFMIISFDQVFAQAVKIQVEFYRNFMLVLIALTIVASIQTVGVVMIAAMLVTPAASAFLLSKRLPVMMGISCLIGVLSSIIGLYISFYANVASGAAIVLTATVIFLVIFLFSPRKGIILRKLKRTARTRNLRRRENQTTE